jgi:hypothetical protein
VIGAKSFTPQCKIPHIFLFASPPRFAKRAPVLSTSLRTPSRLVAAAVAVFSISAQAGPAQLSQEDVQQIIAQASTKAAKIDKDAIIAVTDREGFVLAIWDVAKKLPQRCRLLP